MSSQDIALFTRYSENLLDLLVERGLVAVGTELFDLQPFGGVPAVLFRRVARHAG